MDLHFAYGSNMDRAAMAARCPGARAEGRAVLEDWRFLINEDGYATIAPSPGDVVHGVLWRLTARDRVALDAYEDLDSGLYTARDVIVRARAQQVPAMVYVGRSQVPGAALPGYLEGVLRAAMSWDFPDDYVRTISRCADVQTARSAR